MTQQLTAPRRPAVTSSPPGVCAIVPARGGSKGVPRKNLRTVGGEPLVARAVRTLLATSTIDSVVVSTDDDEIAAVATRAGARVVVRPAHLAGDEASSESAVEHALSHLAASGVEPAVTVLVQATSPFIDPADVDRAVRLVSDDACDVAFSATRTDVHLWRDGVDGPVGVNHDAAVRQRRQDRSPEHAETGAFYVMRTTGFREHGHRFFGRVRLVEVDPAGALEIDTEHDLALAQLLGAHELGAHELGAHEEGTRGEQPSAEPASIPAAAVVTDFDGVHTGDRVVVDQHGVESVEVNRSDGMGVSRLRQAGIDVLILSTETNPVVRVRADKLGVEAVTGCDDKLGALVDWARARGLTLDQIAYLGNDVNDVACLRAVGWPVVVADAHPDALAASPIVLRRRGGDGAVRELADRVLSGRPVRHAEQAPPQQKGNHHE